MIRTQIAPAQADPTLTSAHAAIDRGDYAAALQALIPCLQRPSVDPAYLDAAVSCYWQLGDTATALSLLQVLVGLRPEDKAVWGKMGAMLLSMGERKGAEAAFTRCVELGPRSVRALGALNLVQRFEKGSHRANLLRGAARSPKTSAYEKAIAWNACGRIEEGAGNFAPAFRCFDKSNRAEPRRYGGRGIAAHVTGQIETYEPREPVAGPTPTCIFVVGMPRSGTTLVDKILSRHPLVRSTGEGAQLQQILIDIRRQMKATTGSWDWATRISDDDLLRARQAFLRRIAVPGVAEVPFVVNKLPLGVFDMGFAQQLLPGARFVFMARHPLDVGLSNFCTHFHDAHPYSKSLTGIAHMTRQVYRSLDDYVPKLGQDLRVQSYRALVEDPETQIRALLAHVGLPWDDACLTPHEEAGAVRTASILQVREAINTKGLGKWHRYRDQLAPLVAELGEDWLADWETRDAAA